MNYLNLIRYKNLLFILLLLLLLHGCVLRPILMSYGLIPTDPAEFQPTLPWWAFWTLTVSTLLIAAGGYAINDYFDTKIDLLNHPDNLIVGRSVTKTQASWIHHVTTALGALMGVALAIYLRSITLGFIFVMVPGLLWFYSASYKRQFLVGNIIVAFCAALVPISLAVVHHAYFFLPFNYGDLLSQTPVLISIYSWMCGFALFAFLFTLIREIIKDCQDVYGDRESECRTIPVVLGTQRAKWFIYFFMSLAALALFFVIKDYVSTFPLLNPLSQDMSAKAIYLSPSFRYLAIGIYLPMLYLVFLVFKAKRPSHFRSASICAKFIMAIGVLYTLFFYFLICQAQSLPLFGFLQILQ